MLTCTLNERKRHSRYTSVSFCFENYQFSIAFHMVIPCKQKQLEMNTTQEKLLCQLYYLHTVF